MKVEYIKGVKGRGGDVIALLEGKGGKNFTQMSGGLEDSVYYINPYDNYRIECSSINSTIGEMLIKHGVELQLPPKPNIFEGLKFGDLLRTRGGWSAVYLGFDRLGINGRHYMAYVDCVQALHYYDKEGYVFSPSHFKDDLDIVGKV